MPKRKPKPALPVAKPKGGAPLIAIDMEQLRIFCKLKPTKEDCAAFFKCSTDTVERRIREATGLTYAEYREQSMVHTKFDLIRLAIEKAKKGDNDMMKFCLKNLSDWSDKPDAPVAVVVNNSVDVRVAQLDIAERIELLKGK